MGPQPDGSNDNRDAVAFIKRLTSWSTATQSGRRDHWPRNRRHGPASRPRPAGGLGFGFKWNMGFMHDTLEYMALDPIYRRWNHDKTDFRPDLRVFGKFRTAAVAMTRWSMARDRCSARCPATIGRSSPPCAPITASCGAIPARSCCSWDRNSRSGANGRENVSLDWHLLDAPAHQGVQTLVRDLNRPITTNSARCTRVIAIRAGFAWIVGDDFDQSVFALLRFGAPGDRPVVVDQQFHAGAARTAIGSACRRPGGWRRFSIRTRPSMAAPASATLARSRRTVRLRHGQPASAQITLPPLATVFLTPMDH